jgi:hypothetical protein
MVVVRQKARSLSEYYEGSRARGLRGKIEARGGSRCRGASSTTSNEEIARNPRAPKGFRRRGAICSVAAPRRCSSASPAAHRLPSGPTTLGTRPLVIFGQTPSNAQMDPGVECTCNPRRRNQSQRNASYQHLGDGHVVLICHMVSGCRMAPCSYPKLYQGLLAFCLGWEMGSFRVPALGNNCVSILHRASPVMLLRNFAMPRFVALFAILALANAQAQAPPSLQQQNPDDVFRITVNLVQVDAVVTDSKDHPVTWWRSCAPAPAWVRCSSFDLTCWHS